MKLYTLLILTALALEAAFAVPYFSRADNASSTSFFVQDATIGAYAGFASSTDFEQANGGTGILNNNASSTDFSAQTGPVNYSEFSPQSQNWRWYADADDETPTSPLADENAAPPDIENQSVIKLRLTIKDAGGEGADSVKFSMQFSTASDFSGSVGTVAETGSCNASSTWCYATSTGGNDNAVISTKLLADADACSGGVGSGCGTHNTSGATVSTSTQTANAAAEYEFTLMPSGAPRNTVYFFRAVDSGTGQPVPAAASSSYPSATVGGANLLVSVDGLPQGTATNGVTTTVATTPADIPFGTLDFGAPATAAQRIMVTTNASSGYELYVMQTQPLMNDSGYTIPGVNATNLSPSPWSSACSATLSGCYGYHSGAPVLAGGSTRFAPNDSYASFATSTAEVGYSPAAVTSSTLDMVYKIQAGATQVNGSYQNDISYIIAPSF